MIPSRSPGWLGRSPHERTADPVRAESAARAPEGHDPQTSTLAVYDLTFDVARVELPIGDLHPSLKIWNHIDLMRLDARMAAALARNGLRLGVGTPSAWPAIRTIVESGGGVVHRDNLIVPRGQPLLLDLGPLDKSASIFAYNKQGRAVGKTFDAGRYVLQVDYVYHRELGGSTDVQIGLEIRNDHGTMTWQREGAIIRQVPSIDRHVFSDVVARCTLSADEFLVIGANPDQPGDYLVGNRFLVHERNGERWETVLFLTPKIAGTGASAGE